ncbi:MAG TPA: LysM peptidoglycan-binding domain-containing protein [Armatimonadota bacterium]|jgi:hypothetical protein
MEQLTKAGLLVHWYKKKPQLVPFQFNPTEVSYDKGSQIAEIAIPGLDSPLQQFVRGHAEKVTMDLFFDRTDDGMGAGAKSVTEWTDTVYQLVKIEPKRHAPPICTFVWNDQFPGSSLGRRSNSKGDMAAGALAGAIAAADPGGGAMGNQRRNGFQCLVESVRSKFTLFSPQGVPLRATLSVTLREYKTLEQQLKHLNKTSPDRTHSHVVQRGETLSGIAGDYYDRPGEWRPVAQANGLEDPRRLAVGVFLTVPPLE